MSNKPNNIAQDFEKKGADSDSDEYEYVRVKKVKKPAEPSIGVGQAKPPATPASKPVEPDEPDDIEGVCLGANQCVGRPLGLRY